MNIHSNYFHLKVHHTSLVMWLIISYCLSCIIIMVRCMEHLCVGYIFILFRNHQLNQNRHHIYRYKCNFALYYRKVKMHCIWPVNSWNGIWLSCCCWKELILMPKLRQVKIHSCCMLQTSFNVRIRFYKNSILYIILCQIDYTYDNRHFLLTFLYLIIC